MKIIGITGGIGSGKSTVAQIIERDYCPVYNTDIAARKIQLQNPKAIQGTKALFGESIYLPDGNLDRARLASIVFKDPMLLTRLNELIHPLVRDDFGRFVETHSREQFVAIESAILISSGFHTLTDFNILVKSYYETRISRVMKRDNITREQVIERINNQMQDSEMAKYCKYTIVNDDLDGLDDQIYDIFWKES